MSFEFDKVIEFAIYIYCIIRLIVALVSFFKNGSVTDLVKENEELKKELDKMKYLNENTVEIEAVEPNNNGYEYKWNSEKKQVELVGEYDMAEMLNSNEDCALAHMIDKYLSGTALLPSANVVAESDEICDCNLNKDDAELLNEYIDSVENIRKRFNLSLSMSRSDVINYVLSKSKNFEVDKNNKKGGEIKNAKENINAEK